MALIGGFYDGTPTGYQAFQFRRLWKALVPRPSVLAAIDGALAVTAGPGLAVTVSTGLALVLGSWWYLDAAAVVALASNSSGQTRLDYVVLEVQPEAALAQLRALPGVPGSGQPPGLQQTSTLWQLPLATVSVPTGASQAGDLTVTDRRPLYPHLQELAVAPSAAAGSASALPATPAGYLEQRLSDGRTVRLPFYNLA
jgi:hypothetical protein